MKALIFNNIVEETSETEFPVSPEMTWVDCTADCERGWLLKDGVLTAPPVTPGKTYDLLRVSKYPSIGDQLDMLFHAIEADSDLKTKLADFYDEIKAIKDANPKPS